MDDISQAAQTIANFLQSFTANSGLRLRYRVKLRGPRPAAAQDVEASASADATSGSTLDTAGDDAPRNLYVEFSGPDTPVLTGHNGEVLNALEHVAAKILRLEPEEHDLVSFDADHYKANRDRQMRASAAFAIERVQTSGRPHSFPAMTSRERRMLHLILSESGLPTASSGEGPGRFVVLYPAGADTSMPMVAAPAAQRPDASRIRDNFRHR